MHVMPWFSLQNKKNNKKEEKKNPLSVQLIMHVIDQTSVMYKPGHLLCPRSDNISAYQPCHLS